MYNDHFYKYFLKNRERLKKKNTSLSNYTGVLENLGKIEVPVSGNYAKRWENLGKIEVPVLGNYAERWESLEKIEVPVLGNYAKRWESLEKIEVPVLENYAERWENLGKINLPDFERVFSIGDTLANFSDLLSDIDLNAFEITKDDIKKINNILTSKNPEEKIAREIKQKKEIPNSIKAMAMFIVIVIEFLANIVTITEFTYEQIQYITAYYEEHIVTDATRTDREAINWLNNELKKDVSQQITQNFRIVTKDNLAVRTGKGINTKIKGKLNHGDVVQILEKKKNWTYVSFSNYKEKEVIEGWVFTRYLKQIK